MFPAWSFVWDADLQMLLWLVPIMLLLAQRHWMCALRGLLLTMVSMR